MFSKKELNIQDEENDPKNIQINMYSFTKAFRKQVRTTISILLIALAVFIIGIFIGSVGFEDRISQSGTYIELHGSDCEGRGYDVDESSTGTCYLFVPSPDYESSIGVTVGELIQQHYMTIGWIVVGSVLIVIAIIGTIFYYKPLRGPLRETLHQYIQESYFLNIQLTSPKGNTRTKRIYNLLWAVFPEVYMKSEDAHKKNEKISYKEKEKFGGYTFDFYMDTKEGKFGAIFLEGKLTLEKLKTFTKKVDGDFDSQDDHVICIAKEFDPIFDSDKLEKKMDDYVSGSFNLDILKEDDNNQFSIVWID